MLESNQPETGRPDFTQLERLYRVYGRFAFGLALKQLGKEQAEEIVHQAFLRFWREANFNALKGPAFFGWLLNEVQQLCRVQAHAVARPASGPWAKAGDCNK